MYSQVHHISQLVDGLNLTELLFTTNTDLVTRYDIPPFYAILGLHVLGSRVRPSYTLIPESWQRGLDMTETLRVD